MQTMKSQVWFFFSLFPGEWAWNNANTWEITAKWEENTWVGSSGFDLGIKTNILCAYVLLGTKQITHMWAGTHIAEIGDELQGQDQVTTHAPSQLGGGPFPLSSSSVTQQGPTPFSWNSWSPAWAANPASAAADLVLSLSSLPPELCVWFQNRLAKDQRVSHSPCFSCKHFMLKTMRLKYTVTQGPMLTSARLWSNALWWPCWY